ncbi:hypothetical protein BofuT4_uP101760.1 [Botrytis cinerea T4]|uniref:Uncharacterized protein n=1 Tax=Botryotinia fuckeliana (strain T4) TaxID=999810 RepID=G2YBI6_BOTF4|nr:hypothetical protein BofuT4_uP101760.1 [Botrytis cinerea T4]
MVYTKRFFAIYGTFTSPSIFPRNNHQPSAIITHGNGNDEPF